MIGEFMIINCRHCGEDIPRAAYCLYCGKHTGRKLIEFEKENCPHCEKDVPKGPYCVSCGEKKEFAI